MYFYLYLSIVILLYVYLFIYLFVLHIQCVRAHGCNIFVYVLRWFADRLYIAYGQIYLHTHITHIQVCPFINYEYLDVKGACFCWPPAQSCFASQRGFVWNSSSPCNMV